MHDQPVLHKIEAVGFGLIWVVYQLLFCITKEIVKQLWNGQWFSADEKSRQTPLTFLWSQHWHFVDVLTTVVGVWHAEAKVKVK